MVLPIGYKSATSAESLIESKRIMGMAESGQIQHHGPCSQTDGNKIFPHFPGRPGYTSLVQFLSEDFSK
jgi:hypothetical protein